MSGQGPNVGEFKDRRGEFYVQDTLNGKWLLNRYIWSATTSALPHCEESGRATVAGHGRQLGLWT
jgi:hypothetical protein